MKFKCKKCNYNIKINAVWDDLPKEVECINCKNRVKIKNVYIKIYNGVRFVAIVLLVTLGRYISEYMKELLPIGNMVLNKTCSYILSYSVAIFFIALFMAVVSKIFFLLYK